MGLPNLLQPPPGEAGWREFWFCHWQDHLEILEKLQDLFSVKLTTYVIDPWLQTDKTGILERHQQYHNDMNELLHIGGTDLSEIDFPEQGYGAGMAAHQFLEHSDVHHQLAI